MSDNEPKVPFHPAPSVGHEIGVMLGFMAFFALAMGVYYVLWKGSIVLDSFVWDQLNNHMLCNFHFIALLSFNPTLYNRRLLCLAASFLVSVHSLFCIIRLIG